MNTDLGQITQDAEFKKYSFSGKTMQFLERNRLYNISQELLCMIRRDQPSNYCEYMADNLKNVSESQRVHRTAILTSEDIDPHYLAKRYKQKFNCPIITYTKGRKDGDAKKIISKFKSFLKYHKLDRKNIIMFNFPENRQDIIRLNQANLHPTNVIGICKNSLSRHVVHKPVMNFHKYISKHVYLDTDIKGPQDLNDAIGDKIPNLCRTIKLITDCSPIHIPIGDQSLVRQNNMISLSPTLRIIIIGRRGSGRKTQARLLAKKFNLIYIDALYLLTVEMGKPSHLGRLLKQSLESKKNVDTLISSIIYRKMLQIDCIRNGWVLVNHPTCLSALKFLMINWEYALPVKIVFLHCREKECLRRLEKRASRYPNFGNNPRDISEYISAEMDHFNIHIPDIIKFCEQMKDKIHIDGNHSVYTVQEELWARVQS